MFNLVPDVKYKILSQLPVQDLVNFWTMNKEAVKCDNEKFWERKLALDYPNHVKSKHIKLTNKEWYQRLCGSGTLVNGENVLGKDVVRVYRYTKEQLFFVDIHNDLYFRGRTFTSDDKVFGGLYKLIEKHGEGQLLSDVVDIYIHEVTYILKTDGKLWVTGQGNGGSKIKYIAAAENVKKLIHAKELCLYVSNDDDLYVCRKSKGKIKVEKVAENVSTAIVTDRSTSAYRDIKETQCIYYVTKTGQLWEYIYTNDRQTICMDRPMVIECDRRKRWFHNLLIKSGVKKVIETCYHIVVLDTDGKIWIYPTKLFQPEQDTDYSRLPIDMHKNYNVQDIEGYGKNYCAFLTTDGKVWTFNNELSSVMFVKYNAKKIFGGTELMMLI